MNKEERGPDGGCGARPERLGYLAEDDHILVQVPVEGVSIVDEVAQHLGVVGGGHDECFLGSVVEDQLVAELAVLVIALVAPVGVHVGDLADPYGPLGVLLARGLPPRVEFMDDVLLTRSSPG